MLRETLVYVLETVVNLFALAALMRFYAQAFRASFRNPIAQFVVAFTDWAVKPTRRIVPQLFGLDSASLIVAWLVEIALWGVVLALLGAGTFENPIFWAALVAYGLVMVIKLSIYLLMGVVVVQAVLSWVNPHHPIQPFFDSLCKPFLRPFQRIVPLVGGVDLSPMVLLIALQVLLMLPIALLEGAVRQILRDLPI